MNKATLKSHTSEVKASLHRRAHNGRKAANTLYHHATESAEDLFQEGKKAFKDAQENLKLYSNELATTVQKHPISALVIAGGIGYIISSLFRR